MKTKVKATFLIHLLAVMMTGWAGLHLWEKSVTDRDSVRALPPVFEGREE